MSATGDMPDDDNLGANGKAVIDIGKELMPVFSAPHGPNATKVSSAPARATTVPTQDYVVDVELYDDTTHTAWDLGKYGHKYNQRRFVDMVALIATANAGELAVKIERETAFEIKRISATTLPSPIVIFGGRSPDSGAPTLNEWFRRHYPRDDALEVADPELPKRIQRALEESTTDFRTVASLADELGVSERLIRRGLNDLGEVVRRPLGQESRYPDWYRLSANGPTRQEKRARWKAILSFAMMDDDF
jgi:AraC-like DNA-binding protein